MSCQICGLSVKNAYPDLFEQCSFNLGVFIRKRILGHSNLFLAEEQAAEEMSIYLGFTIIVASGLTARK